MLPDKFSIKHCNQPCLPGAEDGKGAGSLLLQDANFGLDVVTSKLHAGSAFALAPRS